MTIFKSDNGVYSGRSTKSDGFLFADGCVLAVRSFSKLVKGESGWDYTAGKLEIYGVVPWSGLVLREARAGLLPVQGLTRIQDK